MIKDCKSIAEYAMRRWMQVNRFAEGYFNLEVVGNEGTIRDANNDTLVLVYNPVSREVTVKEVENGEITTE